MAVQIQFRRDTAANWTSENPTLAAGELGYETDTGNIKIGDGSTAWTSLAYNGVSSSYVTTQINAVIDSAPGALDTLNELAAALGDDANFATTVTDALALKQDKVTNVSDTEIGYLDGVTSAIQTQLDAKAPLRQSFEDKSANYTFDAADTNKVIRNTSGTAVTFTIPADTFTLGDRVDIINAATGVVTIAAASGVTLLSKGSAVTIDTQYAAATLLFRDTNLVYLVGDIA